MIHNMTGGGAGLNLKVVGGTTQPSGKENTVWVNTSTAINGYAVSATAPSSLVSGMVWLKTGVSAPAPINIGGKNTVMIYPVVCYQRISGAWVAKTAMTYVNGAWKNWAVYLVETGADNTDVTGGWFGKATNHGTGTSGRAPDISFGSGLMTIKQSGSAGANAGVAHTANKIDLTDASKIVITCSTAQTNDNNARLGVWSEVTGWDDGLLASVSIANSNNTTHELDVSAITGEHYVGIAFYQYGGGTLTVSNLKTE